VKATAQVLGVSIGGLASLISVGAVLGSVPTGNPAQIAFVLAMTLVAVAGVWGVGRGRAWAALLLALWAVAGMAVTQISFPDITGIDLVRIPLAAAAVIEGGVALVLSRAAS